MRWIILIIFILPFASATTTYGDIWEKTVEGNKHTLTYGVSNYYVDGEWIPFNEVVDIRYNNFNAEITYLDKHFTLTPFIYYRNEKHYLSNFTFSYPNVSDSMEIIKERNRIKFAYNLCIPEAMFNEASFLGFDVISSNIDTSFNDNAFISDDIILSFFDLRWHEFNLEISNDSVLIGNLDGDYNYHDTVLPHYQNGCISLDPTITKNMADTNADVENGGINCAVYDTDSEIYEIASTTQPVGCDSRIHGWIFKNVDINKGTVIDSAELRLGTWATCGLGGDCRIWFHGFSTDDADIWWINTNEPIDANLTDSNVLFTFAFDDTPNGSVSYRSFDITLPIQEILNRPDFFADTNIGIITRDANSTTPRPLKKIIAYTYDNTLGVDVPQLIIEWTIPRAEFDNGSIFFINNFKVIPTFFRKVYLLLYPIFNMIEGFP